MIYIKPDINYNGDKMTSDLTTYYLCATANLINQVPTL